MNMELKYQNIVLRDMEERDIDDEIRWNTVQTQWALWDAPWEMEEELRAFDPEAHRKKALEWIAKPKPDHRRSLEIDTWDGVHLGAVNCYCIDGDCNWLETAPATEEERQKARWAVGLDICEPVYWNGGWGAQALAAFLRCHLDGGYAQLYTQTWSGNVRMTALAEKLGFRECRRKEGIRQVRGETYDALTFRLDRAAFEAYCARPGAAVCIRMAEDPEEKEAAAASVLADLPDWFGLPDSTAQYVRVSRELPFWLAVADGRPVGFAALKETAPKTAEIYVMGVRPGLHRAGVGRRLFRALYRYAKERGYAFLQVKTVQEGRYPEYDRTNAFYRAVGFTELECFPTLWDEWNPCQVLVMAVQ